jgi:hypothetical protein
MAITAEVQSLWARIQAFMGEFLLTDKQLLDARANLQRLREQSISTGNVKTASGEILSTARIDQLLDENYRLFDQGQTLKGQLMALKEQYDALRDSASDVIDTGAQAYGEMDTTGILYDPGIGFAPAVVSVAAWIAGAGVLYFAISRFLGSVKDHVRQAAGGAGDFLMYAGIAALAVVAWMLFGGRK